MKRLIYILTIIAVAVFSGCQRFEEIETFDGVQGSVVEVLEDGRLKIRARLSSAEMDDVAVDSRAVSQEYENHINSGWCLIFGEDDANFEDKGGVTYSNSSPLLEIEPIIPGENGEFYITLSPYSEGAMLRIVANLTERETAFLESAKSWMEHTDPDGTAAELTRPTDAEVIANGISTYAEFIEESVGLDGLYEMTYTAEPTIDKALAEWSFPVPNTERPDPTQLNEDMPMSSYGFVMQNISNETIKEMFGSGISMIRVASKVTINVGSSNFDLKEVYLIGAANEGRIRSTVLSTSDDGAGLHPTYPVPTDLGGVVDYLPLPVAEGAPSSDPIYFYPNNGVKNAEKNPQYVIFKGRAAGYDTDGYYKVALKAKYSSSTDMSYGILRNTSFEVNLLNVGKSGYKTFADAVDVNNPANNISYSIVTSTSGNEGRNEVLVSNGTYYVDLECSRVYMKGYGDAGTYGSVTYTLKPNEDSESGEYYHPTSYITGGGGVEIISCKVGDEFLTPSTVYDEANVVATDCVTVQSSNIEKTITVNYKAQSAGNLCLQIGDMLKYVPVEYDAVALPVAGGEVMFSDAAVDFSYSKLFDLTLDSEIESEAAEPNLSSWFAPSGSVGENSGGDMRELRAKIYPKNSDGIAKLYLKQDSSVKNIYEDDSSNCFILNPAAETQIFHMPVTRIDAFWNVDNGYTDITGNTLSELADDWETVVMWHDSKGSFSFYDEGTDANKTADANSAMISFESDHTNNEVRIKLSEGFNTADNHCNVVYAVRKISDKSILWSWHLWITDYDPYFTPSAIVDDPFQCLYQSGATSSYLHRYFGYQFTSKAVNDKSEIQIYRDKYIMDRNLGARSASADDLADGRLYYQFGRKDPIPHPDNATYLNGYEYAKKGANVVSGQYTMAETVLDPCTFIVGKGVWCSNKSGELFVIEGNKPYFNAWRGNLEDYNKGKTIFDPSPRGFRIPNRRVWNDFVKSAAQCTKMTNYYKYRVEEIVYPLVGYINNTGGFVSTATYHWSSSPQDGTTKGVALMLNVSKISANAQPVMPSGCVVRVVQEY